MRLEHLLSGARGGFSAAPPPQSPWKEIGAARNTRGAGAAGAGRNTPAARGLPPASPIAQLVQSATLIMWRSAVQACLGLPRAGEAGGSIPPISASRRFAGAIYGMLHEGKRLRGDPRSR